MLWQKHGVLLSAKCWQQPGKSQSNNLGSPHGGRWCGGGRSRRTARRRHGPAERRGRSCGRAHPPRQAAAGPRPHLQCPQLLPPLPLLHMSRARWPLLGWRGALYCRHASCWSVMQCGGGLRSARLAAAGTAGGRRRALHTTARCRCFRSMTVRQWGLQSPTELAG